VIISASRRTDIPAFYTQWFLKRIEQQYCMVRNPINKKQVSRITLDPSIVDCIVFWTKNPERLIPHLNKLNNYFYYFQFTITSYNQVLEPNVPEVKRAVSLFKKLSDIIGPRRVIWRYDPIVLSDETDILFHFNSYDAIARELNGYTNRCVISFIDLYKKTERNLYNYPLHRITDSDMKALAERFSEIAVRNNFEIFTCAEDIDFTSFGISPGKCIDDKLISEAIGKDLDISKDKTQREECGCVASIDIGAYNTCPHGCLYCYANFSSDQVKKNMSSHDMNSPLIFGNIGPDDKIIDRKVESCIAVQKKLFKA
jgi:DNA repair photolyase